MQDRGPIHNKSCHRNDVEPSHDLVVQDTNTSRGDRANCQFRVSRQTKLANDEHIQWRVKHARDLERHRNAAARQSHYDDIFAILVSG